MGGGFLVPVMDKDSETGRGHLVAEKGMTRHLSSGLAEGEMSVR